MFDEEKKLSEYIDSLNDNKVQEDPENSLPSISDKRLEKTAQMLSRLNEPVMPVSGFEKRLALNVAGRLAKKQSSARKRRFLSIGAVGIAAVIIAVFALNVLTMTGVNIVSAMEKAFESVKAYHGVLEFEEINEAGDRTTMTKLDVWADSEGRYCVKELAGNETGLVTVNNGLKKWQVQPDMKLVQVFSAFPDPYRFSFEPGKEIQLARSALSVEEAGEENINGRSAIILKVTPQGGLPYRIWIDKKTRFPLQKESELQNAMKYRVTYTSLDLFDAVPQELLSYQVPEGYEEMDTKPVQVLSGLAEASDAAGFEPILPGSLPEGYVMDYTAIRPDEGIIQTNYVSADKSETIVIIQGKAKEPLTPASGSVLGTIGAEQAEIQSPVHEDTGILGGAGPYAGVTDISSIRWQKGGFEYAVVGNAPLENLSLLVKGMTGEEVVVPQPDQSTDKPKVEVPVDITVEQNDQKSVDAGHSPWKLDPMFVAQVFVSLKISPEGITGDYPISQEDMKLVKNDGVNAVIEVSGNVTPVRKVYLQRLVRQDSTGIWTVVGYDPA